MGLRDDLRALNSVAQLVGASSHTPEGGGFDSQSRHITQVVGSIPVQEATDPCFSLCGWPTSCLRIPWDFH